MLEMATGKRPTKIISSVDEFKCDMEVKDFLKAIFYTVEEEVTDPKDWILEVATL